MPNKITLFTKIKQLTIKLLILLIRPIFIRKSEGKMDIIMLLLTKMIYFRETTLKTAKKYFLVTSNFESL